MSNQSYEENTKQVEDGNPQTEFESQKSKLSKEFIDGGGLQQGWIGTLVAISIVVMLVIICIIAKSGKVDSFLPTSTIERSTIKRTAISVEDSHQTGFIFKDDLGWIDDYAKAEKGMIHFYNKTGVYPMLVLTNDINGLASPTTDNIAQYAKSLYEENIHDQGHLLVIYYESSPGDYSIHMYSGTDAEKCMDDQACRILTNYFSALYYSERGREKYVSDVFYKTANHIMQVTPSPLKIILCCLGVVMVIICVYHFARNKHRRRSLNAAQTKRMLDNTIGNGRGQEHG